MLSVSCVQVEDRVRMYISVSDSCTPYCEGLTFNVSYKSVERTLKSGERIRIERPIGDNGKLLIWVTNESGADNHPLRCEKYVSSKINIQGWTPVPEDQVYVYYNQLIYFQNKDVKVDITCAPLPDITASVCDNVTCWSPPENSCAENRVIDLVEPKGVCVQGECVYPTSHDLCLTGWCFDTKCQTSHPCEDVYCIDPPPNKCDNGALVTYEPVGVCKESDGDCVYAEIRTACPSNQCSNGACLEDPCKNVYCNRPPANHCTDKETLKSFTPVGRCVASGSLPRCVYEEKESLCKYGCADGTCIVDACTEVVCDRPPASYCDYNDFIVFEENGYCSKGACRYLSKPRKLCAQGCREGKCADDLCWGKNCNDPPSPYCANDTTLVVYGAEGTCTSGVCAYTPTNIACGGPCQNGVCTANPCIGTVCDRPPADYCIDDLSAMQFSEVGTCTAADGCDYGGAVTPCPDGCFEGYCPE